MRTLVCFVLLICSASSLSAQGHCSLYVRVENPDGRERDALVTVTEWDGRTTEKLYEAGGIKFCDLGISPVKVTVGHESCNQVVVRNFRLTWGKTTDLKVIYDREACLHNPPPPPRPVCKVMFRFTRGGDQWVTGGILTLEEPTRRELEVDDYGRVLVYSTVGSDIEGSFVAPEHQETKVKMPCARETKEVERRVAVKPSEQR